MKNALPVGKGEIPKRKEKSPILSSLFQESLWLQDQLYPHSISLVISLPFSLRGPLSLPHFKQAYEKVIQHHESLRTHFEEINGKIFQWISREPEESFYSIDLSDQIDAESKGMALIKEKMALPFELAKPPLIRFYLVKIQENSYLALLHIHHIIFDAWSSRVFFKEWASIYSSLVHHHSPCLPDLPIQYGDFALWHREWMRSECVKKQLDYWKKKLNAVPEFLELAPDKPRPPRFNGKGAVEQWELSESLTASIREIAKKEGVPLFVFLFAAFQVWIYRFSNKEDFLILTPFANRKKQEVEPLIGFFVQMLPIRSNVSGNPPFSHLLQKVNQTLSEAYANSDIPLEMVVKETNPKRDLSYTSLLQVTFAFEHIAQRAIELEGIESAPLLLQNGAAQEDLYLRFVEKGKSLIFKLQFYSEIFEAATIRRRLKNFETLLTSIVQNPDEKIELLSLMTPEEIHQIVVEWNDTKVPYPRDRSVPEIFESIESDRIALRFQSKEMTYDELNKKANQFARHLQKLGVKKEDLVAISLQRSFDLIIGMLAILKTGAAYVPIDASYPQERKDFMIQDGEIKVLVTQDSLRNHFRKAGIELVCLDTQKSEWELQADRNLDVKIRGTDRSYINYTSGSTGNPKGVELTHRGILRLVLNSEYVTVLPEDRILQMANISFDTTAQEIWGTLLNGATLCIFPQKEFSSEELAKFILEERITQVLFTARVFTLMVEEQLNALKGVRILESNGDVMSVQHARKAFETLPSCRVTNGYGPTENTVDTTAYFMDHLEEIQTNIPIGRPITNTQVYIVDSHLMPVPIGVKGELCTGGDGVARGYWKRPDLTREKFVPNPFDKDPHAKMYRSGDLARYRADGNIEFSGRIDSQVKIRGFRIEMGEIEEVFKRHEKVADCVVLATEEGIGEKNLVAYLELKKNEQESSEKFREYAASKLPSFMVPTFFILMEKFPITPNGKLDRKALPSHSQVREQTKAFVPPKTTTEKIVADIWSCLLNLSKIGREDHFFHLGGHSIAAAQLSSCMSKAFKQPIPVGLIFENATLEKYAKKIEQLLTTDGTQKASVTAGELFWIWRNREAVLDSQLSTIDAKPLKNIQFENPQKIFLTGSTGFVGAFLLRELLDSTKATIYCHIRAKTENEAKERLKKELENYLIWDSKDSSRIQIVLGDLEKPLLGIAHEEFDQLAEEIDSIFHVGAYVNHALPYQKLKASNVLGTQEALRLASQKQIKPFHFVSTTAVLDRIPPGQAILEDIDIRESKFPFTGYAQSKWVGEKIVLIARARGIPTNIYRLARVSGDSKLGSGPTGDFLWRVMNASIRLQMAPEIEFREDVTPVDYVCKALRYISSQPREIDSQYHLLNPQFYDYRDIFKLLKRLGYTLKMTDFLNWRKMLVKEAIETGEVRLGALAALLSEQDLSQGGMAIPFDYKNTVKALQGSGIVCPKVDEKLFEKYIAYYVKIGYFPSP